MNAITKALMPVRHVSSVSPLSAVDNVAVSRVWKELRYPVRLRSQRRERETWPTTNFLPKNVQGLSICSRNLTTSSSRESGDVIWKWLAKVWLRVRRDEPR
jgi:hypothetical protein